MKEQKHEIMLKQESRKLREEDMKKLMQRQKRLDFKKKFQILEKEKNYETTIKTGKEREQSIIRIRCDNQVKLNIDKEQFRKTMDQWAHTGFSTSRSKSMHTANNTITEL